MPKKKTDKVSSGGSYFESPTDLKFIRSGCSLLDCVIGGGWALGRIGNVVGDASSGKTLLAIEACANFAVQYPDPKKHRIRYREVEAAFDNGYAKMLGMPLDRVEMVGDAADTVENFEKDLTKFIAEIPADGVGLYIVDSLDALSDESERKPKKVKADGTVAGSYGTQKAKQMSGMFRKLAGLIEKSNVHLMVISQVRDKIGVTFGERTTRAGGRALKFYASQEIWLAQLNKIKVTRGGVVRPVGILVKANNKKSKVGMPYRDCKFPILFAFGIDDVTAALDWLEEVDYSGDGLGDTTSAFRKMMDSLNGDKPAYKTARKKLNAVVRSHWREVERRFLPKMSKY